MTREVCGCCWVPIELCEAREAMSLSDRLRPDVECAAWVIEEVKKLEADAARYRYLRNRDAAYVLKTTGPAAGCWIDCDDEDGELTLLTGEDADAAIDVAIRARGEKP